MAFNQYLVKQRGRYEPDKGIEEFNVFYKDPSSGVMRRITDPSGIDMAGVADIGATGGKTSGDINLAGAQKMFSDYELTAQQKAQQQTAEQKLGTVEAYKQGSLGRELTPEDKLLLSRAGLYKEDVSQYKTPDMLAMEKAGGFQAYSKAVGAATAPPEAYAPVKVPGPSALKYYNEGEIERKGADIYLKPGVPVKWDASAYAKPEEVGTGGVGAGAPAGGVAEGGAPAGAGAGGAGAGGIAGAYTAPKSEYLKKYEDLIDAYGGSTFDAETERKKIYTESGVDAKLARVDELEGKMKNMEGVIRNREAEIRNSLAASEVTEGQIQREITSQLKPLQTQYRDLYDEYQVAHGVYSRAVDKADLLLADRAGTEKAKREDILQKGELYLKGYGLESAEEKEQQNQAHWVFEQSQQLQEGKSVKLEDGTVIKGIKTTDPETVEYEEKNPDGHTYKVKKNIVVGPDGKKTTSEEYRIDMGMTTKTGEKATTAEILQADVKSLANMIETGKDPVTKGPFLGVDGFISPENYKLAARSWANKGYKIADFDVYFGLYRNPSHLKDYKIDFSLK